MADNETMSAESLILDPGEEFAESETSERDDEIQGTVQRLLEEAVQHLEEEISDDMVRATDYYHGRPFGNERDGRSQVVSTDVRDVTLGQLPSLMRIFFSPERTVEFAPRSPEDIPLVEQQTDMVRYVITNDNDGFLTFYSWFKDALVRRLGVVKWWWDTEHRVEASQYTGLTEEEFMVLAAEPDVSVEVTQVYEGDFQAAPGSPAAPTILIDATATRRRSEGVPRIACVPNEEFVFTPYSRGINSSPMVAHVREVPADELRMLGIDEELIEKHQGKRRDRIRNGELKDARQIHGGKETSGHWDEEDNLDVSQLPVLYAEAYSRLDGDGDDVAELRYFQCLGDEYEIVNGDGRGEIVDEVPFAVITPDPEPHTIIGLGNYDLVGDVQLVKSQVWRHTLDSLALAVNPQQEVVEGEVNMKDLLNPELGTFIRVRRPGMVREVTHRFVGGDTLPVLAAQDEVREHRTGFTKTAAGLDADTLQSTTKAAAAHTITASQQRVELIARVFAETGVSRLFKGLLRLMTKHQNRARVVRLRNQWVSVDPRHWDATMDVQVNVGLGQGPPEERIQALSGFISVIRELMQAGSPLVSNIELRRALGKAAELYGWHGDEFFRPWGPEQEQQYQQMLAQQPQQPDPTMMLVQIEQMKATVEAELEAAKLELERWKATMDDDRERDKMSRETVLKEFEIEAKHATEIEDARIRAAVERERAALDADVKREVGVERERARRRTRPGSGGRQ